MKLNQARKKLTTIMSAFETNIDKLVDLAEEFEDDNFGEMVTELTDNLSALILTGEASGVSCPDIVDYLDELTEQE